MQHSRYAIRGHDTKCISSPHPTPDEHTKRETKEEEAWAWAPSNDLVRPRIERVARERLPEDKDTPGEHSLLLLDFLPEIRMHCKSSSDARRRKATTSCQDHGNLTLLSLSLIHTHPHPPTPHERISIKSSQVNCTEDEGHEYAFRSRHRTYR